MQNKRSSVMDNLYKIGDKIAEASAVKENGGTDAAPSAPAARSNVSVSGYSNPTLNKALLRRYDDLLRTKRDLVGRLVAECETLRQNQENARTRMELTDSILKQMEEYLDTVQKADCDFNPEDQSRLANECRKIENIRIEVIRLQSRMKNLFSASGGTESNSGSSADILMELESLTLSQLFRFGWSIFLPLILAAVVSALLICGAIILSYNGVFLWR